MFIPEELAALKIWINFDVVEEKKIPYVCGTTRKALSNDPSTWSSLEEAQADGRLLGIAIQHPYVFVDLDEPQPQIFEAIDTYAQTSHSGKGAHLICRSHFEGDGIHPKKPDIGIFQERRFCLFTGDVIEGRSEIKDIDPDLIQRIYDWAAGEKQKHTTVSLVETPPSAEDEEVFERCRNRFDTFESLWNGNAGEDHSASDHALIAMLADECESNEQVRRMWFASALCRPHRKKEKYVDMTLKKIRGKQEYFKMHEFESPEEDAEDDYPCADRSLLDSLPEGTIKEVAEWHYSQCRYPLQECSIVMALASAATVSGRNYQIQGGGLNPWMILIGTTGCGKSSYQNGMSRFFHAVANSNEFGTQHFAKMLVGKMASGEGLEDILTKRKRINSYFPEFHETWQGLVNEGKARHLSTLKQALLDLHGQASKGSFMKQRVKAFGKEETEEKPSVEAPCLVVSGETTPEEFYSSMTARDINNGWLQRFMLVDVSTKSISLEKNLNKPEMPPDLLEKVVNIFVRCEHLEISDEFVNVILSKEAAAHIDAFELESRKNNYGKKQGEQASNRGAMKALQIGGLFAIWDNPTKPVVNLEQIQWALNFVLSSEEKLKQRFRNGEVGTGQSKQEAEIVDILTECQSMTKAAKVKLGIHKEVAKHRDVVPYLWLKRRVIPSLAFASDRIGSADAFERCLKHLEIGGQIIRIKPEDAEKTFGKGCGPVVGIK